MSGLFRDLACAKLQEAQAFRVENAVQSGAESTTGQLQACLLAERQRAESITQHAMQAIHIDMECTTACLLLALVLLLLLLMRLVRRQWKTSFQLWAENAFHFAQNSLVNGSGYGVEPAVLKKLTSIRDNNPACCHGGLVTLGSGTNEWNLEMIVRCAATGMTLKFGKEDEFASLAFTYLFQRGITCYFFDLPLTQGNHYFVVVGPKDNAMDPSGWVCDPRLGCYPITQIHERMASLSVIPLESAICRAVNMNEDRACCSEFVNWYVKVQLRQLSLVGIGEVPNFSEMHPISQLGVIKHPCPDRQGHWWW